MHIMWGQFQITAAESPILSVCGFVRSQVSGPTECIYDLLAVQWIVAVVLRKTTTQSILNYTVYRLYRKTHMIHGV